MAEPDEEVTKLRVGRLRKQDPLDANVQQSGLRVFHVTSALGVSWVEDDVCGSYMYERGGNHGRHRRATCVVIPNEEAIQSVSGENRKLKHTYIRSFNHIIYVPVRLQPNNL